MKKRLLFSILFTFLGWQLFAQSYPGNPYIEKNYVGDWGKLKLVGTQLSSASGNPVQLKGWSTHGWQFGDVRKATFDSKAGFAGMKSFGANVARIAAYISPTEGVNDQTLLDIISWIKRCMAWTYELNMYCIVDFHVHDPGFPTYYLEGGKLNRSAEAFFREICSEASAKGYNHVLYEICNEPSAKNASIEGQLTAPSARQTWEDVKAYTEKILPIIEEHDPNAVVIIGTPQACLRVDVAASDPISTGGNSKLNIMYTFHFYACSHLNDFNRYMKEVSSQIPIFATEWSLTAANGTGNPCNANATTFTDYCRDHKISWCSWSWCAKRETSAAILASIRITDTNKEDYIYSENDLTEVGLFVKGKLQEPSPSSLSEVKNILFGIYPNPAKDGVFNISLENNSLTTISISNVQGKMVYSSTIENKEATINANLKAGVYVVTIKNENGTGTQKLVVE